MDPTPLAPSRLGREALGWWALQFTPRVAWLDEALLMEVSDCERLWGGRRALLERIHEQNPAAARVQLARGATSLIAMAMLRLRVQGIARPPKLPDDLPLWTLNAARSHLQVLERLGCRTWGDVNGLPRGGLVRRFGAPLRDALDQAWAQRPERHAWLTLPERFERKLELPALATGAPELMWSAQRLLGELQLWLRARQCGVLAMELEWTHELRRVEGVDLPPTASVLVRTAEPTQDTAHLRRLMAEQLARLPLAAPASWLALRSVEVAPWAITSLSFLPEERRKGDRLHQLVERLSARLGDDQVQVAVAQADHRPEAMQRWQPAKGRSKPRGAVGATKSSSTDARTVRAPVAATTTQALYPPWLLREPLALSVHGERPFYQGVLKKRVGPQRLEAGWWVDESQSHAAGEGGAAAPVPLALRDYYVAESPGAGLVWIFCERPSAVSANQAPRWFLQGVYA